jgi:hypothetical protein
VFEGEDAVLDTQLRLDLQKKERKKGHIERKRMKWVGDKIW